MADAYNTTDFCDVPTALKTIVGRLDDWLQANPSRPTVRNPVLWSEVLSNAWDETRYANFRDKVRTYRQWIDDAYAEPDRDESIGKWRRVFGDDFAVSVVVEKAASISSQGALLLKEATAASISAGADLVARFARWGRRALPEGFDRLPHKQRPLWRSLPSPAFSVKVSATLHSAKRGAWLDSVDEDRLTPLQKGQWLQFSVRTQTGLPLAGEYDLHWRVTNTDVQAHQARCLRGGFEKANDGSSHWEALAYRGVHTVEAFVVRQRDKVLVAQSAPFYVVVE